MKHKGLFDIIKQAAEEGWTELDLSNRGLTKLPLQIGKLTALRQLHLGTTWGSDEPKNRLTQLPQAIGELTNLEELDLSGNYLGSLPAEIGLLTNLRKLNLNVNQLDLLPLEMTKLASLEELGLRRNYFALLPPVVTQLRGLTSLTLANNQIAKLPREIGQLVNLITLKLGGNRIDTLPPEIDGLASLTVFDLHSNRLIELPPEVGQLVSLKILDLRENRLEAIPPEIGKLVKLRELYAGRGKRWWKISNPMSELPPEIGELTNLEILDLRGSRLTSLLPEVGKLTNLKLLDLEENQLTMLPTELGQLQNLKRLKLLGNALSIPPREIVVQGTQAVLAYLRGQLEASRQQWLSKMIVVGEGGVGKTAVLRALRGEPFDSQLSTTHGIEVKLLESEHPTEPDVVMQLNAWDFGGQEIYHATHQFFLTNRSLFVLVWNARYGYQQGKLYYWLDAIQARAPESPVLLVATHIDERDADLPLRELRTKYPQIVSHCEVSSKTGEGIDHLRESVADAAASLPLMGESWPASWLNAVEALLDYEEKFTTPQDLWGIMASHGVSSESANVLAQWMHELGDILYYQDDEDINDLVILKPQWVTEYISKVLESDEVIGKLGIFTRTHMDKLWSDVTPAMRNHFLRLMERFDLSYRTLENREISLVVERLPLDPPDYESQWDAIREITPCREISMRFKLNTIPAGIPTWFIARSHRFSTHTHWRNGVLFADSSEWAHLALVYAMPHDRYIQLTVRGPSPYNFFALLKDGIELTLQRFPGLKIERLVPCPGHNGTPCGHEFDYTHLQNAIEKTPPILEIECPVTFRPVSVPGLLFGLHWRMQDKVLERLDSLKTAITGESNRILAEISELRELAQREFTGIFRRDQSRIESECPNVFVLRPRDGLGLVEAIVGRKLDLKLYCQSPGCWHPTIEGGSYTINDPANWIKVTAPYIRKLVSVLKYTTPLAGPWAAWAWPTYETMLKDDIRLMTELVKKLPDLEESEESGLFRSIESAYGLEEASGPALRALRQLLDEKDPEQHWGGLRKVLTPEGHYLWLCEYHAQEYVRP